MGISTTPFELAAKMAKAAQEVATLPDRTINRAALLTKTTIQAGAPSRLRGVGKRGANLSVRYRVSNNQALVFAQGPWQLVEHDTSPHEIPRARTRGRQRFVVFGDEVYSHVNHPGTKGKQPWAHGVERALPLIPRVYDAELLGSLHRVF